MSERPSFVETIKALRITDDRYPWVLPTADELDVADALEIFQEHHSGSGDEPDECGHWGTCSTCGTPWPCPGWLDHEQLALQWIGRGFDRYHAHAQAALDASRRTA